jgi:ankyrin repeat protein
MKSSRAYIPKVDPNNLPSLEELCLNYQLKFTYKLILNLFNKQDESIVLNFLQYRENQHNGIILYEILNKATDENYINVVKLLLDFYHVDCTLGSCSAIEIATENGYIEMVKLFLEYSKIDVQNFKENILLKRATRRNNTELVELFSRYSSDIEPETKKIKI